MNSAFRLLSYERLLGTHLALADKLQCKCALQTKLIDDLKVLDFCILLSTTNRSVIRYHMAHFHLGIAQNYPRTPLHIRDSTRSH